MITLEFDNFTQLQIFFFLINNKPIERDKISYNLGIPRTTIFDNIQKLKNKSIEQKPYVNTFIINNGKVGRNKVLYFIPKFIKRQFLSVELPNIKVEGIILNYHI